MPTTPPVTDKDGNKVYRSDPDSLANQNVTRPAPLETEQAGEPKKDTPISPVEKRDSSS